MRSLRRLLLLLLALLVLAGLTVGCQDYEITTSFEKGQYETEPGADVALKLIAVESAPSGCAMISARQQTSDQTASVTQWRVDPADGASVGTDGRFTASRPGEYTVTAVHGGVTYTTTVVVAGDGSVDAGPVEAGIDVTPLLGTWQYPIKINHWDEVDTWKAVVTTETETMVFSLSATGTLVATRQGVAVPVTYDGTTVTVGDTVFAPSAKAYPVFIGTVAGSAITGQITYPGGDEASVFDAASETRSGIEHLTMPWSATKVQ